MQTPDDILHIVLSNHNRQTGKTAIARNLAAAGALWGKPSVFVTCETPDPEKLVILHSNPQGLLAEDLEIPSLFYFYLDRENSGSVPDFPLLQKEIKNILAFLPEVRQVIWDAPSSLSSLTRAMLRLAHIILLPFRIEEESFERLGQTLGILERIKQKENTNLLYWGLLPAFIEKDRRLSEIFSGLALPLFKTRIIPVPIPEDSAFGRAEEKKQSVFSEDLLSIGAHAVKNLSDWIGKTFSAQEDKRGSRENSQ